MTERITEVDLRAAFERGYRRGRIEASAELHAVYRSRILDATSILSAPIPQVSQAPGQDAAEPLQERA